MGCENDFTNRKHKMKKLLISATLFATLTLTLSGCSVVTPIPNKPAPSSDEFSVRDITQTYSFPNITSFENYAELNGDNSITLVVGGSGSCPPAPSKVTFTKDTVTITAKEYTDMACTMDYRQYAYIVNSKKPDVTFKDKEIQFCTIATDCRVLNIYPEGNHPTSDATS